MADAVPHVDPAVAARPAGRTRIDMRVSVADRAMIERDARAAGRTITEYLLHCAEVVAGRRQEIRRKEDIQSLIAAIGPVGNNLNQLTRRLNNDGHLAAGEAEALLGSIRDLLSRLRQQR